MKGSDSDDKLVSLKFFADREGPDTEFADFFAVRV